MIATATAMAMVMRRTGESGSRNVIFLPMPNVAFTVAEPTAHGDFLPREKLDAFFALHVQIPKKRFVPPIKGKPCHRGRYADVDAHLPRPDVLFECPRCPTQGRKYRCPMSKR